MYLRDKSDRSGMKTYLRLYQSGVFKIRELNRNSRLTKRYEEQSQYSSPQAKKTLKQMRKSQERIFSPKVNRTTYRDNQERAFPGPGSKAFTITKSIAV